MRNYLARKCINYLKEFGHNNLKAIPQIFCQIFNIEVSFLNNIHIINPKLVLSPNFPKLKNMSLEGISALRKRIDRTFSQTITEKKNLLKNYDTEVDKAYNGYVKYLDSIPSQAKQIIKEKKPDIGRHTNTSLRQVLCTNCLSISFNAN